MSTASLAQAMSPPAYSLGGRESCSSRRGLTPVTHPSCGEQQHVKNGPGLENVLGAKSSVKNDVEGRIFAATIPVFARIPFLGWSSSETKAAQGVT